MMKALRVILIAVGVAMGACQLTAAQGAEDTAYPITGDAAWAIYDEFVEKMKTVGPVRYEQTTVIREETDPIDYQPEVLDAEGKARVKTTMTSKVWMKGAFLRSESVKIVMEGLPGPNGELVTSSHETAFILIQRPDVTYSYDPTTEMFKQYDTESSWRSLKLSEEDKRTSDFKIIGTEVVDGRQVTVWEMSGEFGRLKSWVWEAKGLEIRMEFTGLEEATGSITQESRNFVFEDIPDSMFDVSEELILEEHE